MTRRLHVVGTGPLCATEPPDLNWTPGRRESVNVDEQRAICARCSLQRSCLEDALSNPDARGIRGGSTARDRTEIRRLQNLRLIPDELP